jgi:hypothetical protein
VSCSRSDQSCHMLSIAYVVVYFHLVFKDVSFAHSSELSCRFLAFIPHLCLFSFDLGFDSCISC